MKCLIELRKQNCITQSQMAAALGISRQAYSNYELGNREPDNRTLLAIADYFNVSIDYLLGREEKKPTDNADGLDSDLKLIADLVGQLTPEQLPLVLSMAQDIPKLSYDQLRSVADVIKNMVK